MMTGQHNLVWACGLALSLAAGCDSSVAIVGGGGSGSGGGGQGGFTGSSSTSGAAGGLPAECQVETTQPAPYEVVFQLQNPSAEALFVRRDCTIRLTVTACADGYNEPLALWSGLAADCHDPEGGCVMSEPCGIEALPVTAGAPVEEPWHGRTYTYDTNADDCPCYYEHTAPAAKYLITVPVYGSEDVEDSEPLYEAAVFFELPAPGGVVAVPLPLAP